MSTVRCKSFLWKDKAVIDVYFFILLLHRKIIAHWLHSVFRSAKLVCEEIGGSSAKFDLDIEIDDTPLGRIFAKILSGENDYVSPMSPFDMLEHAFVGNPYNIVLSKYFPHINIITDTGSKPLEERYIMPIEMGDIYMGVAGSNQLIILVQPVANVSFLK